MASMFMIILIHEALFVLLIPSFPERKGWITLVCSQLDFFFNYHFLIACVHLIHWLITMGSVWSLDLVYVVFPIHGQILWSCGGRKALVFWGFFCIHGFEGYPNNFLSNKFFYTHGTMKWNITLKKQLF